MIDFGYRATHEMTLKAKQIVKAFYDRSRSTPTSRAVRPAGAWR
jgi:hypothetical protein